MSPLIFLATDTAYLIPVVRKAFQEHAAMDANSVVVLPQFRLQANQGVTFDALEGTGQKCLEGWQAMVSDMMLLAHSNVLVAARHSTFTQSLPLSMMFARQQIFCEVSDEGVTMTCVDGDMQTWLFRDNVSSIHTFVADAGSDSSAVSHRITLLLPDVSQPPEFSQAKKFLTDPWTNPNQEALFPYGQAKIYKKYRNQKPSSTPGWNFV